MASDKNMLLCFTTLVSEYSTHVVDLNCKTISYDKP